MPQDEEAITEFFKGYVLAFQTLKPRLVALYCNVPCMFIGSQGARVMTSASDVESWLSAMMAALKARGYARSDITDMKVSRMSDVSALVSVRRVRYGIDRCELERLGETYTRNVNGAWQIITALVHDPDSIVGKV